MRACDEKRFISPNNYKQFGIDDDKLEQAKNQKICDACWLSKNRKLGRNTCSTPGCSTSQRQIGRLYKPPLASFNQERGCEILESLGLDKNSRICKKCYHKVLGKGKQHRLPHGELIQEATATHQVQNEATKSDKENTAQTINCTSTRTGRPKVAYTEASEATKRRIKAEAKSAVNELFRKCQDISQGCGQHVLNEIADKTPLRKIQNKNSEATKMDRMLKDLRTSYDKENQVSSDKIRLLSTVATHFSNKELKSAFPCSDYEITKARHHAKFVGAGVTPETTYVKRYRIPVEDIAFVVDFLHHPDNATRSSHRMASCEGKKSSWLSELFQEKSQPVMWLRDSKNHLYAKYKAECEATGRRPISETKFREGLNAGNFKEMLQMVGLCNICDEIGARNWEFLEKVINELITDISKTNSEEATSNSTSSQSDDDDDDSENEVDRSKVQMVDISSEEIEYSQLNPLPYDSPVLLIQVGIAEKVVDYATNKDNSMNDFLTRAKVLKGHLLSKFITELESESNCPFHCMSWLLDESGSCEYSSECSVCIERFHLFDDINATILSTQLSNDRKAYYVKSIHKVQENLQAYIGHLVRGKYQRMRFMKEIEQLQPGETIAVSDYMMKLLLQKFREPQRDWYAKKGVSVHGTMFFYKSSDSGQIEVEIHDVFSNGDCVQNWFFTASAFEATFSNFSAKHKDITKLYIWSDNGPHYHNTSLVLWLMRFSELCPIRILRYSFFEAQKGKTSLDSHFATFKFVLKGWMKQGNDILKSEDIVNGTLDHLKGTHVYEIYIDREKEPKSATTLNGISRFGCFTYVWEDGKCIAIDAREQTNNCKGQRFLKKRLFKLWNAYLMSASVSTGVKSDFIVDNYEGVEIRFLKTARKEDNSKTLESDNCSSSCKIETEGRCPNCGKNFLRHRWLQRHMGLCSIKQNKIIRVRKTAEELRKSLVVTEALGGAIKMRKLDSNYVNTLQASLSTDTRCFYKMILKGSARKQASKTSIRFTPAQKEIMEFCFNEGESDKRKRFTALKCQKLMQEKLCEELVLTEKQIKSYWSAYKRKKT